MDALTAQPTALHYTIYLVQQECERQQLVLEAQGASKRLAGVQAVWLVEAGLPELGPAIGYYVCVCVCERECVYYI
jgi:hypothetical protein